MQSTAELSPPRILIVDDDPHGRMAMQELLRSPHHEIVLAASGEEALRAVLKCDFAAILLDVHMPGLTGFEVARMIRERERSRQTPIIFLTAGDEDLDSVFRGYEAGAVDYMIKPPVPWILESKLAVFVELYNKNAVLRQEIAERARAEEHLRASEEKLRALAAHLQSVREEEWTRISREIHDELGQALTGLKMDLVWIGQRLPDGRDELQERVQGMTALLDHTVQSVREIAARLRPAVLDQLGLTQALSWLARDFARRAGIRCKATVADDLPALDPQRSTAVFRVCQELLTNVLRHADASRVEVSLSCPSRRLLLLEVEDNGRGMDARQVQNPLSMGLLGVRERILPFGGRLEMGAGADGQGTRARVAVPLMADTNE